LRIPTTLYWYPGGNVDIRLDVLDVIRNLQCLIYEPGLRKKRRMM